MKRETGENPVRTRRRDRGRKPQDVTVHCGLDGKAFFTIKTLTYISVACLLTYCGCKSYSFFTGANPVGWEIPKGTPGALLSSGFILPLNICVGLVVACTMYGFYALFTKGEI